MQVAVKAPTDDMPGKPLRKGGETAGHFCACVERLDQLPLGWLQPISGQHGGERFTAEREASCILRLRPRKQGASEVTRRVRGQTRPEQFVELDVGIDAGWRGRWLDLEDVRVDRGDS